MEPLYVGDLVPSIASYKKIIEKYDKGIKEGEFYEEPIGGDFNYPDWWICLPQKQLLPWQIGLESGVSAGVRIFLLMSA